jgi:hypothetical protein
MMDETPLYSSQALCHHVRVPSIRPSFAEREAFRTALSQAYADGRIDDVEFDHRSTLVETGISADELREALRDLPQPATEFPTTVTRAEALESQRLRGQRPHVSRRGLFLLCGGALGAVAGLYDGWQHGPAASDSADDDSAWDYPHDAEAIEQILGVIEDKGYREFTYLRFYSGGLVGGAKTPKGPAGIDGLEAFDDDLSVAPESHLSDDDELFRLDGIAFELIPAMSRSAIEKLGGRAVNYAEVGIVSGEPTIRVAVDGDDYGVGAGSLEWSADGEELLRIHRDDED